MRSLRLICVALWCLLAAAACIPEEPEPPPPEFPGPTQPSLKPVDNAEVIASWDFSDCAKDWTVTTQAGTSWACGPITRGPGGDRTGEGSGWGVGMSSRPAGRTETMLTSPGVTLDGTNAGTFTLSAWHWLDADGLPGPRDSGGGIVEVFDSNSVPVALEPIGGYDGRVAAPGTSIDGRNGFTDRKVERVWRRSFFDLSAWAGRTIRIRFHAGLGTVTPGDGWFLDDVEVFRGGVVEDVIDTDLSTCGAGEVIRFPFRTCDEGFGATGTRSSWACGPATPLAAYPDAPVGDGPQFDVDDSGLLFATAPSGMYNPLEASELVSPAMDLSGCVGRTTSLSFWHWYHFAPAAGGWVEVWDGQRWVEVTPVRGYGGPVQAARLRLGRAPDGFVTSGDRPSGWRFEVFDVSPYVNEEFRVRFRFFAGILRRPGWYVDTVALSTFALEDLPRLDGDPKLPGCGFGLPDYESPDVRALVKDPCLAGEPIVPSRTVYPGDGAQPDGTETVDFNAPQSGAICLVVYNGATDRRTRVGGGAVTLDDQQIIPPDRFTSASSVIRERQPVSAGRHTLRIVVSPELPALSTEESAQAGQAAYTYQVLFQRGNAMPAVVPPLSGNAVLEAIGSMAALDGRVSNLALGRDQRGYYGKLEFDGRLPAVGPGPQVQVVRFVVQIADPRTCRQVAEVRRVSPVPVQTADAWEEAVTSPGFLWDGRDEQGRPVRLTEAFVRIFSIADMLGLDALPVRPSPSFAPGAPPPQSPKELPFDIGGPAIGGINVAALIRPVRPFPAPPTPEFAVGSAHACSREIPWTWYRSCAPSAAWGAPAPFAATRYMELVLSVRPPSPPAPDDQFHVRFRQLDREWLVDLPPGEVPGWTMTAPLPAIGDAHEGANPSVGSAWVSVQLPRSPTWLPDAEFRFRGARLHDLLPRRPVFPLESMTVRGHLLATYRVRFQTRQRGLSGYEYNPYDHYTTDEPLSGAYDSTASDARYAFDLPDGWRLTPGSASAEVRDVGDGLPGYAVEGTSSLPFTVRAPYVDSISPTAGRVCPDVREAAADGTVEGLRDACTSAGVGAAEVCLHGRGFAIPGWNLYLNLAGYVVESVRSEGHRTYTTLWDDHQVCFFLPEEAWSGYYIDQDLLATGTSGIGGFTVDCRATPCTFRPVGRLDNPFVGATVTDLCPNGGGCEPYMDTTTERCQGAEWLTWSEVPEERDYVELEWDNPDTHCGEGHACELYFRLAYVDPGPPERRVNLTPPGLAGSFWLSPGGLGGVQIPSPIEGLSQCGVLAVLSYDVTSTDRYKWRMFRLRGRRPPESGDEFELVQEQTVNPWVGPPPTSYWVSVWVLASYDGTVGILTVPDRGPGGDPVLVAFLWDLFNNRSIPNPTTGSSAWTMLLAPEPWDVDPPYYLAASMQASAIEYLTLRGAGGTVGEMTDLPVWVPPPDPPSWPRW